MYKPDSRQPNFNNLLKVLKREKPDRATLFELFLNPALYVKMAGKALDYKQKYNWDLTVMKGFEGAGYDYANIMPTAFSFPTKRHGEKDKSTLSINSGSIISSREDFEKAPFDDPDNYTNEKLDYLSEYLHKDMKIIIYGPSGVLENAIAMVGYENLCMMMYEEPDLVEDIFEKIGTDLYKYYTKAMKHSSVGGVILNDDWGFNSQTMLSPKDMKKYVFPWHKKIVTAAHENGIPAILHSCGYYGEVIDDVIDDIKFDARHSYEDNIEPVEIAYEKYHDRIAILGGIDVNMMVKGPKETIEQRAKNLIKLTQEFGGYALGTGNSVPEYIPDEHYLAMIDTVINI